MQPTGTRVCMSARVLYVSVCAFDNKATESLQPEATKFVFMYFLLYFLHFVTVSNNLSAFTMNCVFVALTCVHLHPS